MKGISGIILFLFTFFLSEFALSQNHTVASIYGEVKDDSGTPLISASVELGDGVNGAISDSLGVYKLTTIKTGKFIIKISAIGYFPQERPVYLRENQSLNINFTLKQDTRQLSEVKVTAAGGNQNKVKQIRESGFNVNVVNMNDFSNISTDINQVIKRTTGILVRESGGVGSDFTFQINGLAAKIYIDDIPMDQYGSSMTLNNIPVNLVDRVEIYKGVVPASLGSDAMGGAVNIITKQRTRHFLDASYSYGSFNTHQLAVTGGMRDKKTGFKIRASGYYNSSDNDYTMYSDPAYDIRLEVAKYDPFTNSGKMVAIDKAKRFHDKYWSAMGEIEAGFEKVKWADWATVGLTYSENMKQIQTGASVNAVYGGKWSENFYLMPSVKYRKNDFLTKGLFANVYANYSRSNDIQRDTALQKYDWSGGWIYPLSDVPLEEQHDKLVYDNFMARANFNYDLDAEKNHSLNLNYVVNSSSQKIYDLTETEAWRIDKSGLPGKLVNHIAGLTWQGQWFQSKLISVLSAKYYGMSTQKTMDERTFDEKGEVIGGQITAYKKYFGYPSGSFALRYRITSDLGLKASIERGYNLPDMAQLYGDGGNYLPNYNLKPEGSDNYNFGIYYNHFFGDHFINLDASGFYRNSKNYIAAQTEDNLHFVYYNLPGVKLYGAEGEAKYGYKDMISLTLNGSYDKAIDNTKFTELNQVSLTYKEQIPNRPWIYGNADLSLSKRDLIGKNTRLQFSYMHQYIHWFFLSWENLGGRASKNFVPTQTIHSAVLTYSWLQDKYNISVEARNFTNEKAYDNFRLQKPGRAFYIKFRVSLM